MVLPCGVPLMVRLVRLVNTKMALTAMLLIGMLVLNALLIRAGAQRPSVLIVHSQDEHIPWTRGIDAGISHVLREPGPIRLQRQYLQRNQEKTHSTIAQANDFITQWKPNAVMLVDDLAQRSITSQYLTAPQTPTVYVGIEDHTQNLSNASENHIQGIVEKTPWPMIEDSLMRLWAQRQAAAPRKPLKIALIADTGAAAQEEAKGFAHHSWKSMEPLGVWHCDSMAQWAAALDTIAKTADVVVVGDYRYMNAEHDYSPLAWRQLLAHMALSKLPQPMTALSAYAVADGIPMGILPSPFEQGEIAALMAQQSVRTSPPPDTPLLSQHMQSQRFALLINTQQLHQRHLSVDALDSYFARLSARTNGLMHP